ncbi:MAG: phage tail tube protein [Acetobacter okinawensis]
MPPYTGSTTGYAAGEQTNAGVITYIMESAYKVPQAGAAQDLRFTSETLAKTQTTSSPDEINELAETSQTVVTQVSASGSISGAMSYGTYDDMLAAVMTEDWRAAKVSIAIDSKATPAVTGSYALKSATHSGNDVLLTAADLSTWPATGIIHLTDATNGLDLYAKYIGINGGLMLPAGTLNASDGTPLVADGTAMSDGTAIVLADIMNGTIYKTWSIQKKLGTQFQIYPGSMVSQAQISLQQGQVPTIQLDMQCANLLLSTSALTQTVTPRTTSLIMDTVGGFAGATIFGKAPSGCVRTATLTLSRDGNAQDIGMGHADACGIRFGSFKAAGSLEYFFKDYTEFQKAQSGVTGPVTLSLKGEDGRGYVFVFINATLRNFKTLITGKNATVVAQCDIEANPAPGGLTFAIFRI